MNEFYLECQSCGFSFFNFSQWFSSGQHCPDCGSEWAAVRYKGLVTKLVKSLFADSNRPSGLWKYSDVLPLENPENIITAGEGDVQVQRWYFLEQFALKMAGIECKVYAHRHDNNNATGSFKDLAGSLVASILKEHGISEYVVATTGNIGVALARYIAAFQGVLYAFLPECSSDFKEAEIAVFGQRVFRVLGDYNYTTITAKQFAQRHGFLSAAGTLDPMRVEAKKTMAFEWFRRMPEFPTVYIQAISGGTGPIGIAKGCQEMLVAQLIQATPRFLLVQTDGCAPIAEGWKHAKSLGFPEGWTRRYPIYHDPQTNIPTLATGNPKAFPVVAQLVKESNGEIFTFAEQLLPDVARIVAFESAVRIGPAAAVAVGGFFQGLAEGMIRDGDRVVILIGEGIRRDPEFMVNLMHKQSPVKHVDDCSMHYPKRYREKIWTLMRKLVKDQA